MAEAMALEMRGMALDGPMGPSTGSACLFPRPLTKPVKDDSAGKIVVARRPASAGGVRPSAAGAEVGVTNAEGKMAVAANKAATARGMAKASSWSEFEIYDGGNKAGTKASAKEDGKASAKEDGKASAVAAKEGGKASALAAKEGGKASALAAKEGGKERVPDSYIQYLLEHPPRRPPVVTESFFKTFPRLRDLTIANVAKLNKIFDWKKDVLRQYHKKGYAEVGVHFTDDGQKILSPLPEEE